MLTPVYTLDIIILVRDVTKNIKKVVLQMTLSELKEQMYIERTCYEDYFNVRDRKTETITFSGTEKQVKDLLKTLLKTK